MPSRSSYSTNLSMQLPNYTFLVDYFTIVKQNILDIEFVQLMIKQHLEANWEIFTLFAVGITTNNRKKC